MQDKTPSSRRVLLKAAGAGLLGLCAGARAQVPWPDRPIKVVVPYPPGGNTDMIAREVMRRLSVRLRQSIVIDNKPGANSILGTDLVAKAAPDGYTLLLVIGAYANNQSLYKSLPFSPKDFAPVSLLTRTSLVVVTGKPEFKTLDDLVRAGRSGQELQFGSSGVGSAAHLLGERFARLTGMRSALHVPYKGTTDAMNDLISGRISFMFDAVSAMGPHIKSGKLTALAVTGGERSPMLPQVPSVAELGYAPMVSHAWAGLLAPAQTPRAVIDRLATELAGVLADPELKAKLADISTDTVGSTPGDFTTFIDREVRINGDVIRDLKIILD